MPKSVRRLFCTGCNHWLRDFQGGLVDLRQPGGYTFTIENKKGDHPMSLGENIARLRARKNWSQEELARALDVSRQSVSKWETDASVPDLDKLVKLGEVFGVSLDELVQGRAAGGAAPCPAPLPAAPAPACCVIAKYSGHTTNSRPAYVGKRAQRALSVYIRPDIRPAPLSLRHKILKYNHCIFSFQFFKS